MEMIGEWVAALLMDSWRRSNPVEITLAVAILLSSVLVGFEAQELGW